MNSSTSFQGIIFDLDGTLFDSLADLGGAMNEVLHGQGYPTHSLDDYRYFVGNGMEMLVSRALPPGVHENRWLLEQCLKEMRTQYGQRWDRNSSLYRGIPELLDQLLARGMRLNVLTNKPAAMTAAIRSRYLDRWPFQLVWGATENYPLKPDPTAALAMAAKLGLNPAEIIFVGDSGVDMQTALAAGMYGVGCLWGFRSATELNESGAQELLREPQELLAILDRRSTRS